MSFSLLKLIMPLTWVGKTMFNRNTVELGYNVMKRTEYFVSLQTSVVITEEYDVMLAVRN